jgi:hypothetical protein
MSIPSNSGPCRLVKYEKRNFPLLSLSNALTIGDTASESRADKPVVVQADFPNGGDDNDNYEGLEFKRVLYLERLQVERNSRGGPKKLDLVTNVNPAHSKLAEYYAKFDDVPVHYTATILHPQYKHHLSAL